MTIDVPRAKIPLVDLSAQYFSIQEEIDAAIRRVVGSGTFIGGNEVRQFEAEFAEFCRVNACVGVANGTDALSLSLRALGVGPGDEVLTVAHTFFATAEAISSVGATPVFVEIDEGTLLMDPEALESAITPRSRAVIPVHLYGQPCKMDRIVATARRHGLKVIEDAAQAHGAAWGGRRVGSWGDLACFSFYPAKNLGAYGDGGAVVGEDEELIELIRRLANHGRREKYTHEVAGVNSRLDALQAGILRVKLRHLEGWNARRRLVAERYRETLASAPVRLPVVRPQAEPVWHLYVVRVADRERFRRALADTGIETGVHYPLPLHRQPAYRALNLQSGTLPISERAAAEVVSLPMYPELSPEQVDRVAQAVGAAVR